MIYNFNLGIGWASSGVEYAQAYRARVLRSIGADAKFIFTGLIFLLKTIKEAYWLDVCFYYISIFDS